MTDQHQTEAQRLAALLRSRNNNQVWFGLGPVCDEAALELLRLNAVHTDLERVKMQLAACGVVAMADTPDSAKKARIMHPDYESASCDDVKRRVDECIALRARVAELEDVLTNLPLSSPQRLRARIQRLEEMLAAVGAGGVGPLIPATVQHQRKSSSDNELPSENGQLITSCSTVPAGWKPVPLELTQAMLDQLRFGWSDISTAHVFDRWKRTVAAGPQPPVVEQSDGDTVPVPRSLLGAACAAISSKRDAPKVLEQLRRYTTGDLSTPAAAPQQGEQEPRYLDGGSRYKITHLKTSGYCVIGLPKELLGQWVALVDATNNKHMSGQQPKREPLTKGQIDRIVDDLDPLFLDTPTGFEEDFCRAIERAHGIGGEA